MPDKELVMKEVKDIVTKNLCFMNDLKLDKYTDYNHIIGMWNFHKLMLTNIKIKKFNESKIRLYGTYYKKYKFIRDSFEAHTKAKNNHIILFYIKDNSKVLLCYKSKRRKDKSINPYLRLVLPLKQFDIKSFNLEDVKDTVIRMLFFAD